MHPVIGPEHSNDLGSGVYFRWVRFAPDRDLNPQYDGIDDEDRTGVIVGHVHDDGEICEGYVAFDTPANRFSNERATESGGHVRPTWTVNSYDPLHIEPSVHMDPAEGGCGLHGHIRDGIWVGA